MLDLVVLLALAGVEPGELLLGAAEHVQLDHHWSKGTANQWANVNCTKRTEQEEACSSEDELERGDQEADL